MRRPHLRGRYSPTGSWQASSLAYLVTWGGFVPFGIGVYLIVMMMVKGDASHDAMSRMYFFMAPGMCLILIGLVFIQAPGWRQPAYIIAGAVAALMIIILPAAI